jgi:hypothetical protein
MTNTQSVRGKPASDELRAKAQAVVDKYGDREAARLLRLTRATLARVVAGFPLIEGTHATLRERLGGDAENGRQR